MSTLYVDNLQPNLGSQVEIPNLKPLAGSVVQVVSAEKSDTFLTTATVSGGWADTGLSVTITPNSSTSKIAVFANVMLGVDSNSFVYMRLVRDNTPIFVGNTVGSRPSVSGVYYDASGNNGFMGTSGVSGLDAPSTTSSVTYKIQMATSGGTSSYMNRSVRDSNFANYDPRGSSQITVMEIAQ